LNFLQELRSDDVPPFIEIGNPVLIGVETRQVPGPRHLPGILRAIADAIGLVRFTPTVFASGCGCRIAVAGGTPDVA
jgi:hypothetical protein